MSQYKIVYLNEKAIEIVKIYPLLIEQLYSSQKNVYETKQVELFFQPITMGKEKLLQIITQREDYSYYHGIHQLLNPITNEKITLKMNEYDIEVEENDGKNVIFDIIKGFSQKFYMIHT